MRVSFISAMILLLSLIGCRRGIDASPGSTRDQRVVVLLTLDTLRYDSIFSAAPAMPLLARRIEKGLVFDQAYSATSTTQPSHASMFTGLHPWRHGVLRNGYRLDDRFETIAEHLQGQGWATAAVVASYPLRRGFGFEQGFDHYDDVFSAGELLPGWRKLGVEQGVQSRGIDEPFFAFAEDVVVRTERALQVSTDGNQFLWVHFFDAHDPYGDTPGASGAAQDALSILRDAAAGVDTAAGLERAQRLYDVDCGYLDRVLDALFVRLEESAAGRELHIVLVADHGESLGLDDDSLAHGTRVTKDQVHVPMAVLSPSVVAGRSQKVAGSVDVAGTVLELALGRSPETDNSAVDGGLRFGDGLSALGADSELSRAYGMRQDFPPDKAQGAAVALKFTRLDGSVHLPTASEFYVRSQGDQGFVGNSANLAPLAGGSGALTREEARLLFARFEKDLLAAREGAVAEVSDEEREALEALGYVP